MGLDDPRLLMFNARGPVSPGLRALAPVSPHRIPAGNGEGRAPPPGTRM